MHFHTDNRNATIRKTDKGFSDMISDCSACVTEAKKKLEDANICKEIEFNKKTLQDIVGSISK